MTSDRNFWGVTAYDWDTNISDWGHSWLAKKFLTNFYTVSFGPGNQNQPPDTSQYANAGLRRRHRRPHPGPVRPRQQRHL